jgi:hypothetical protein
VSGKTKQVPPKYRKGDLVCVAAPGDSDNGKTFMVEGLSPSTQKKRTPKEKEWRYSLFGSDGYFNESQLLLVRPILLNQPEDAQE